MAMRVLTVATVTLALSGRAVRVLGSMGVCLSVRAHPAADGS
jgi:hypothetical protein